MRQHMQNLWYLESVSMCYGNLADQKQKLASLIRSCTHPIYLARSSMSNLQNRDTDSSLTLSGILGVIREKDTGYGSFCSRYSEAVYLRF
jgi:hypothetical protein